MVVVAVLGACGGRERPAERADSTVSRADTTPIPPAPDGSFAAVAVNELTALRTPVTLREWLRTHTADYQVPNDTTADATCARSIAALRMADGSLALRRAIFYPPQPDTAGDVLPDSAASIDDCVLGSIVVRLQMPVGNDSAITASAQEMRRVFPRTGSYGGTMWQPDSRNMWRSGEVGVIAGRVFEELGDMEHDSVAPRDTIFVVGSVAAEWLSGGLLYGSLSAYESSEDSLIVEAIASDRGCDPPELDSIAAAGERRLQTATDRNTQILLHFLIGDALSARRFDKAELATRDNRVLAAMSHYRAGLLLDRSRTFADRRRVLWTLWRLEAGLPPAGSIWQMECGD